jgi:hypothetical protein
MRLPHCSTLAFICRSCISLLATYIDAARARWRVSGVKVLLTLSNLLFCDASSLLVARCTRVKEEEIISV